MSSRPKMARTVDGACRLPRVTSGRGAGDNDAGVAQTDERDEEADATGDRGVQMLGNGPDETLAYTREGESRNMTPERKTAPSAVCHGTPIPLRRYR